MPQEIENRPYRCPKLNDVADLELTFVVGRNMPKVLSGFHCNDAEKCGVAEWNGMSKHFDWTKCVHPESPNG